MGDYYTGSGGYVQTLIEEWNGTSWSIVASPDTSTTENNYLYGVNCLSASGCVAVGYYINTGGYHQTLVEQWNGMSWSIVTSPNTSTTENNYLYGVSCVTASFCMVAGNSDNTGGYHQTLVEQWNGTSWSIVTSPDTSTTENNYLSGMSCTSASFCMAAGHHLSSGSYGQTLIEQWNGTSWSIVTNPDTSTTANNYLFVVSCTSASFCMAAGYYDNSSGYVQTLIEQWNGTSWSIVTSPNTSTTESNWLNGVSCTSTSFCMAAGYYSTATADQTVIEEWDGTSWAITTSPNTSTTENNDLQSVSCVSSSDCVAAGIDVDSSGYDQTLIEQLAPAMQNNNLYGVSCVSSSDCMAAGWYYTGTADQTVIEEWSGSTWSIVTSPNTSTTENNFLRSVSCFSSSDCVAVGYYTGIYGGQTLIEQWNGTSWSIVTSPDTSTTENNYLRSVSCTSTSYCMAAGYYYTGTYNQTLIEQWNGTSWSIVTSPDTSTTENNYLRSVSCTSTSYCMAAGYYYTGTYNQTLVEEWNGSAWSSVASPSTSTTASNFLYGVSCTSTSFCMAAGRYINGPYDLTLVEEWNGAGWSIVTSPNASLTFNYLLGVSCTTTSFCMAAGYYTNATSDQTLVEEWNGTSWSIATSPNTSTTQTNYLHGINCVSASDCWAVGYYYTGTYNQTLIEQFTMVCSGGSLNLTSPSTATFPGVTLNGMAQTTSLGVTYTPDDETGTGNGWNIDITSTTFTDSGGQTLPTTATTVTGVASVVADAGNCSLPTNTIAYPVPVPAGSSPPTAIPFYSANTGTGEGPSDVTLDFAIAIPAGALPGSYSSTWTTTIASGP